MDLSKEEKSFLAELILNSPVQTTIKGMMGDLKLTPLVTGLLEKLQEPKEEVKEPLK